MPCAICGGSTRPAAKLCGNCKAALKRARRQTVSQLEPPPRRPGRDRRAETRGKRRRATAHPPARLASLHLPASIVALGVVVLATGYFVSHLRGAVHGSELAAAAATPGATPYVPLPAPATLPSPSEPFALPAREALPVPAPAKPAPAVRPAKPAAPPREATVEPPRPATMAAAEPVAPAANVSAQAEPLPPDRWQRLAAAIADCGGGLGGVLCGERARWHYCDGYWGKVAQCPGAIGADVPR